LLLSTVTASGCHGLASPASHNSPLLPVGDLRRVLAELHRLPRTAVSDQASGFRPAFIQPPSDLAGPECVLQTQALAECPAAVGHCHHQNASPSPGGGGTATARPGGQFWTPHGVRPSGWTY
jgi:hypothetical protein